MTASQIPDARWRARFRRRLLFWFRRNARDLPWRNTRDPYAIWVSEIMLQQTQVQTVKPYFERFLNELPDVQSLAAAEQQSVLRLWEGLGYYRRARQMHAAARVIVDELGGEFPPDAAALQSLPGIGRYTAGAIASIAFDARAPILEANTIRLLARLLACRDDPTRRNGQRLLWSFAEDLLPRDGAGRFNQALMELGSLVCTPKSPACRDCPAMALCPTFKQGLQSEIPPPKAKTKYEERHEAAVVIRRRGKVLLRRCGEGERWAGLWDFPRVSFEHDKGIAAAEQIRAGVRRQVGFPIRLGAHLATIKHGVTRFRITLACYEATHSGGRRAKQLGDNLRWTRPTQLSDFPLSTTGRRLAELVQRTWES